MFRLIQLNLLAESISKIDFMCFYKKKKPCKNKVLSKSWLGRLDSNQRMSAPKADALPLGDAPIKKHFNFSFKRGKLKQKSFRSKKI